MWLLVFPLSSELCEKLTETTGAFLNMRNYKYIKLTDYFWITVLV